MKILNHSSGSIRLTFLSFLMLIGSLNSTGKNPVQPVLGHRSVNILKIGNLEFKDLNKDGHLDKYEDWRLSPEERSADLLSKMSVEEKAGFMLINTIAMIGAKKLKQKVWLPATLVKRAVHRVVVLGLLLPLKKQTKRRPRLLQPGLPVL